MINNSEMIHGPSGGQRPLWCHLCCLLYMGVPRTKDHSPLSLILCFRTLHTVPSALTLDTYVRRPLLLSHDPPTTKIRPTSVVGSSPFWVVSPELSHLLARHSCDPFCPDRAGTSRSSHPVSPPLCSGSPSTPVLTFSPVRNAQGVRVHPRPSPRLTLFLSRSRNSSPHYTLLNEINPPLTVSTLFSTTTEPGWSHDRHLHHSLTVQDLQSFHLTCPKRLSNHTHTILLLSVLSAGGTVPGRGDDSGGPRENLSGRTLGHEGYPPRVWTAGLSGWL